MRLTKARANKAKVSIARAKAKEKECKDSEGCDDWGVNLRVRGVQAPVCKPMLSIGEYTSIGGVAVLYGDSGYLFHKGSKVAKKIDAWIQKEMRDSQYHGCTVAYKENNVYNI